jgi:hypothetical protein
MPNIPIIKPDIDISRDDAVTLILVSIALEEIALSHIMNAEAEKLQKAIGIACSISELSKINHDVKSILETVIKKEMLLQSKLEEALKFASEDNNKEPCQKKRRCCKCQCRCHTKSIGDEKACL